MQSPTCTHCIISMHFLSSSRPHALSVCTAEFQNQSSARIQLSRITELFPGTKDRVMLISGTVNQVLTALHLVLAKMSGEKEVLETMLARYCLPLSIRRLRFHTARHSERKREVIYSLPRACASCREI